MATRLIALLIALALAPVSSSACSIPVQIMLDFQENSAELDGTEIIRLANWLDKVRNRYEYGDADVEGSASTDAPDSKNLAKRRAEVTARALHSLYAGLPIRSSGNSYPQSESSNRNYAVVQLNQTNLPDCNPVPIPGFKR